jgi:hypothetical protein
MCGLAVIAVAYALPSQDPLASAVHHNQADLPPVIFTAAPVYDSLAALHGGERFPKGAQLMVLRSGHVEPLVPELAASADASVSFDGKTVLFAGKINPDDPWQLWQVPVNGGTPQLVLSRKTNLIRPLWMPDGRMVYARQGPGGFILETAALDGSGMVRLSYVPGNFIPDDVLRDGRVLFESEFPLGSSTTSSPGAAIAPEMFLVYADGSGVESVRCDHPDGGKNVGRAHGHQISSDGGAGVAGDIVFTHGSRLARFTSAQADEVPVAAPAGEFAGDVAEMSDGRWVLSMRRPGAPHFGLAVWKPGSAAVVVLAQDSGRDLIQPVVVTTRAVPNRHPSALHEWTTGNLMALDARESRSGTLASPPVQVRAETLGTDGRVVSLGTAPVENDGSFFVQAAGDRPLRFILLDAAGHPLREEHGWFWVRNGEQRICVGCHTGPERAPENRVPLVLLRSTTPVDLTGGTATAAMGGH